VESSLAKKIFLDIDHPPKKIDYLTSLRLGWDTLKEKSFKELRWKSGIELVQGDLPDAHIRLKYFEDYYRVLRNERKIYLEGGKDIKVSLPTQILLLHYLNTSDGKEESNDWITYRQFPTGPFYYPAFKRRSISILEKNFKDSQESLKKAALELKGEKADFGDLSFVFKVLPRVKIALAFWRGDQEFSSKISLMFDKNITHYLPLEDISVVCQELAIRLTLKNKKSNKKV
jgi:hypothetical protein